MVTLLIAAIALSTPQVPGAKDIRLLPRRDVAEGLQTALSYISVVSDDGAAVFTHGKTRRFLLDTTKTAPEEDVFFGYLDKSPVTYTTSQLTYVSLSVFDRRVDKAGFVRVAAAPDKDRVAIGCPTEAGLWLTTVRWNSRTKRPNVDTVVPGGKGHFAPYLLGATISGGQPVFYYMQRRSGGDALVYRRRHHGSATLWGRSAFAGDAFDPATKVMVGSTVDGIRIAKLGGSVKTVEHPRGKRSDVPELFFHRGRLFAACDPVYELVGTEWKPFGNVFRILAKSSNEKYWLIGTEDKSVWKVTF